MPRFARIAIVNFPHHVTQRGNARQFILATHEEREVYLDLLRKYAGLYGGWPPLTRREGFDFLFSGGAGAPSLTGLIFARVGLSFSDLDLSHHSPARTSRRYRAATSIHYPLLTTHFPIRLTKLPNSRQPPQSIPLPRLTFE